MKDFNKVSKDWWKESAMGIPKFITETPGPKSKIIPAGHILRMSPPLIMDEKYASQGMDIIEGAITEVEKEFGYR